MSRLDTKLPSGSDVRMARPMDQLKQELHEQLINGMDLSVMRTVDPETLRAELRRAASQLCRMHADLLTQVDRERLTEELVDETLGLGPLEVLMNDPTISDILINGPSQVYVERRGRLELTPIKFRDLNHLIELVQRIVGRVGRRIDESSPLVDARLPDGSRLNAVFKPLALEGALISIRRFSTSPLKASDLIARKSATREMFGFLAAAVNAGLNVLISGGTGAGKTTLLNVLSSFIPSEQRIATIEDAAELQLAQPHVARMETRPPNLEGKGEITSRDLLKNALRMRPDRIIVGECRGTEAFDMLQAMNTGHDGGLSTIHANDTRDALNRLEMLVGMAAPELPMTFIHRQIASAIQIVVQVTRLANGERKVTQISEVTGMCGEAVNMHDLFVFNQHGTDANGQTLGDFEASGLLPDCLKRFEARGIHLPRTMFERGIQKIERADGIRVMR